MCQHIHDPICYPYLCYPPTRVCLTSCVRDAFCADWGHECRDGVCVPIEKESGDEVCVCVCVCVFVCGNF